MKFGTVFFCYLIVVAFISVGCAGPVSPFGGIEVWSGDGQLVVVQTTELPAGGVTVHPKRQVLHQPADFKIALNRQTQLKVTYNKKEITRTFLKSARLQPDARQQIQYIFNRLNLKPDRRHQIDVYSSTDNGKSFSHLSYLPPVCPLSGTRRIASTEPFKPKPEYIRAINSTARSEQLSPALLAGLIAQESGFNPTQVSRAKAVGLTQVTPIADEEIRKFRPDWLSDPRIEKLSVLEIENLIRQQKINRYNDWRLEPKRAIEGGALYVNYLINYWNSPESKNLLRTIPTADTTEVILASYNSGAARVKSKIKASGERWLDDDELKEAFKYVNNVVSYCYHFSEEN